MTDDALRIEEFAAHRDHLRDVAYRMVGQVSDAEDIVQEAWLRWSSQPRDDVRDPRAFLVTMTSRLALDRLRRIAARRETYTGEWLPEPLATPGTGDSMDPSDPSQDVERAEELSYGLLVVLEALSPLERVVFVLREAFGYAHAEIAEMLGRTEAAVRQLAHRAKAHVDAAAPRFAGDPSLAREAADRFLAAARTGDLHPFLALLAPDVELVADGGGKVRAPLLPVRGVEPIGRFLAAVRERSGASAVVTGTPLNGSPAVVVWSDGQPAAALLFAVGPHGIARIFLVGNPDKLANLG